MRRIDRWTIASREVVVLQFRRQPVNVCRNAQCQVPPTLEAALVEHAPDAIIFADREGIIRLWNARAVALFGHTTAEAVGQSLDLIVPEPSRAAHWAGYALAVQRGRFKSDTVLQTSRALTKGGGVIAIELSAAIIRSESGEVRGIMAIGRDIDGRRAHGQ